MGKQKIQSRFVWKGGLFCCELMCDVYVCVLRVSFILLSFMYLFFVTVFFNDCFVCSVWSGAWLDSLVQSTTYHYRHYSWPISRPPRRIKNNVSSVVEFKRWWVLKCKLFAQESTCSKEILLKQSYDELWFVKKCQNCTFKVNFLCQKSTEFFQIKIHLRISF